MSSDGPPPSVPNYTGGQIALIVFGALFLLPGLCSLLFAIGALADFLQRGHADSFLGAFATLWAFCFAISALGIFMIRTARKRARQSS
jgi:hypothetical protein